MRMDLLNTEFFFGVLRPRFCIMGTFYDKFYQKSLSQSLKKKARSANPFES